MYYIIDKEASEKYNRPMYVVDTNSTATFTAVAKSFRIETNAQKYIDKTFKDKSNYKIIKLNWREK